MATAGKLRSRNDRARRAVLGLRVHSGWAMMVAVAGARRTPVVVERRRIEMVEPGAANAAQPYHAAQELDLKDAEALIERSAQSATRLAARAMRDVIECLAGSGYQVAGCAMLTASGRTA